MAEDQENTGDFAIAYQEDSQDDPTFMIRNFSGGPRKGSSRSSLGDFRETLKAVAEEGMIVDFPTTLEIFAERMPDMPISQLPSIRGLTRLEIMQVLMGVDPEAVGRDRTAWEKMDLDDLDFVKGCTMEEIMRVLGKRSEGSEWEDLKKEEFDNVYLEGKVVSNDAEVNGFRATYGKMEAGLEDGFSTRAEEHITITHGSLSVLIEGDDEWKTYKAGETFVVPENSSFRLNSGMENVVYRCLYMDSEKMPVGLLEYGGAQMQFSVRYNPGDSQVSLDYRGRLHAATFDEEALYKGDHLRFIMEGLKVEVCADFDSTLAIGIINADLERGLKSEIKTVLERAFAPYDLAADLRAV